nr:DUF4280 domain-containing protein [uncultured Tyzzerella sp.]
MGWLEESKNYLNSTNEKNIENQILQSKEQIDKQNKEDYVNLFLSDEQIKEELKEQLGKETTDEQLQQYLEENYDSFIPEQYVVRGAKLFCSCGSHERKLNVFKDHAVYTEGFPMVHELDKELEKNITFFGVCSSGDPLLSSQSIKLVRITYDQEGNPIEDVVSGTMCVPFIIGGWRDTKENVKIIDNGDKDISDKYKYREDSGKGYKSVTTKSFLICRYGGIIEPLDSGQVILEGEQSNQTEKNSNPPDPNKDKEVLKGLLDNKGTGINLSKEPEKFIKHMEYIINNSFEIGTNRVDEITDGTLLGDLIKPQLYNDMPDAIIQEEFKKVMVDLYRAQQNNELDVFSYDQTREIAKLINEAINSNGILYIPTKEQHYFRNVMNDLSKAPENLEDMLKEVKEEKWKLVSVGEAVYHKQGDGNNMYNLKFVSVDYDESGKQIKYGYFEAVYTLENPNDMYTKENPPKGILLDRDKDFINMGTYNYGGNTFSHTIKDVLPYNGINGMGNVGEDTILLLPNDYELFFKDKFKDIISTEDIEEVYKNEEKIKNFIKEMN